MIKKLGMSIVLIYALLFISSWALGFEHTTYAQQEPAYAKWGRLAMIETKKRYPNAQIIDYLHDARKVKNNGTTDERFKLWLREGDIEYGVYITINFDTETEEVKDISFIKTSN